nr:hypothetical protein [Tanacetum cinerariifolium]
RVRQDTDEIYMRLDDEQTERQLLAGRLNMLFRDRRAHAYTRHLMQTEARMSREAWVRATDASDLVHGEVMSLRTTVLGQMLEIKELQAADRRRQTKQMAPRRTTRSTTDQETVNATTVTNAQLQAMINQGVTAALVARDALRSTNGDDSHNSGTGTEGVPSLSQWYERMESVFHISNCAAENQVKFAACTLHSVALTWWNTHVQTIGHEAAYDISSPFEELSDIGSDEEESSKDDEDDEDDEMDIKADEEEEEEHPAPADSVVVASIPIPPPPHPAYRTTTRISISAPVPMPAWTDSEVVRLLAISSPPASPLSPWSSPPPWIPFPPLPPILSPPSPLPSSCRREDRPEVTLPPRKRLDIALGPRYEVRESSSAAAARPAGGLRVDYGFVATMDREIMCDPEIEVGYGITDLWDEIVETLQGAPVSTDTEWGGYVREFETRVRQDTYEIYMRLDDEQTERQLLAGQLNMLFRDRRAHAYTCHLMETEARMSREAWVRATDASDLVHGEVMSLRTTVLGQMLEIKELQAADCRSQTVILELLRIDHRRPTEILEFRTALQGQVTALQGQVTALQAQVTTLQGQQGLAGSPTQSGLPEEAGGSA